MKSKFKKLMAAALVLCLMLALLPAGVLADDVNFTFSNYDDDTFTAQPDGSVISVKYGHGTIKVENTEDNNYTLTATPDDQTWGLQLLSIGGVEKEFETNENGVSTCSFTVTDSASTVAIKAAFKPVYNVTVDTAENGRITVDKSKAFKNDTVQVTITPDSGYHLKSLTMYKADGSTPQQIEGSYTFSMPAYDVKLVAEFEQDVVVPPVKQYSVHTSVDGYGGTIAQDNRMYAAGEEVTVSVTANKGYELDQLYYYETGSDTVLPSTPIDQATMTFKMPDSNVMVVATFKPIEDFEYSINVETDNHCKAIYQSKAEPGEWVEVCIDNFDPGYHLYSVTFNGDLVTDDVYWYNGHWHYSFRMPWHDVDIYVATTDKLFVNTVYDINGGAVELWVKDSVSDKWDSTYFADAGDWVCFKATPYSGYDVGSVSVTGRWYGKAYDAYYNRYDGCYYFKMPYESVNLSVSFIDNSHKVTVKDVTNGSLKANTKWAVEGERVYITAVPDKGYELTWLYVKAADGSSVKVYEAIKEDTYYFFMPDQEVTVSAIFAYDYPDMPFIDVNPNSWYYSAIEFVYNKGIMNGVTASSFNPDGTITRGMIVTMLWRMAGEPSAVSAGFADVAADSYYAKAIAWAAKNGIIEGYSASSFGPNDAITREQLATVLYRYAKYLGYTTTGSSLSGYYDASRVSSWAKDAMGWAVKNGVVTGLSSTWLNPNGTASRAEAAQMFMNFYDFLG